MRIATFLPWALFTALAPAAYSQSTLYTIYGNAANDHFGRSVSSAGDVNGDGINDLIVGANQQVWPPQVGGYARVFSGTDGSILYTFFGNAVGDRFGQSVSGAGDVNGDGFADLIVGAPRVGTNGVDSGSARVLSGIDGSILYTFYGDSPGDWFGAYVSGAGDLNGDGFGDLIVGSCFDDNNGNSSGSARVFSGLDGSILYTFDGDLKGDHFCHVGQAGDVNADGYADVIVGAGSADINGTASGMARVFSGLDGSTLYTFYGDSAGDRLGDSVCGAGDVNGDGFDDLIVGALYDDNNGVDSGSARVFSGLDGSILYTFYGDSTEDRFGKSVSSAGDVDGDGFDDLIVGVFQPWPPETWPGYARVLSGKTGSALYTLVGDSTGDWFGHSVSGAGDLNGDGFADLIVGASFDDNNGDLSGSARVFSGCDALGTSYCSPAVANSTGQAAVISACGSDLADGGFFMLHASDLPLNKFGYFLVSATQGFVANSGGSQGNLCLGGQIGRFAKQVASSGPTGKLAIRVDLTSIPTTPPHTVVAGETWNFQCWFRDKNPGPTSNFTDGLAVTFQ